eukprot:GSChrysophyteH1.ASY1.ANO1.615.1 assembled CDS
MMAEEDIFSLNAKIASQGTVVRGLKKGGGSADEIAAEVAKLVALREKLAVLTAANEVEDTFNRTAFDQLMLRKMYVVPSFEIHNGPAANILALWRKHFVVSENMLEMECTNLTPSNVLETSGHVERFTDFMTKDEVTGECFRADKDEHRIVQRQADAFSEGELWDMLKKYNVRSPTNKDNGLTKPYAFNLMFKTSIGPDGKSVGFLRPETAQGLFVNFRRLYEYNQTKMPFSAAQVGLGFRNEIAPRGGLLRVREFCLAEIEHFLNPDDKKHPKFVNLWLEKIGCDPTRMRFRQHLKTEMAHYSQDCWDMEIEMSNGWTECAGHADRACFDLERHGEKTKTSMAASMTLAEPIKDGIKALKSAMEADSKATVGDFELTPDMVAFKVEKKTVQEMKYIPHVIEPTYGIGRILNAVLEHSFAQRNGDENRCVMNFKPIVAPIKLGIFRLVSSPQLDIVVSRVHAAASAAGIVCRVDSSAGTVGRRYSRADELGVPFGVTVDFTSLQDDTVTLRDRNTMAQVRIPIAELVDVISDLCAEKYDWSVVSNHYALIKEGGDDEEEEDKAKTEAKPLVVEKTLRGMFSRPNPNYKQ